MSYNYCGDWFWSYLLFTISTSIMFHFLKTGYYMRKPFKISPASNFRFGIWFHLKFLSDIELESNPNKLNAYRLFGFTGVNLHAPSQQSSKDFQLNMIPERQSYFKNLISISRCTLYLLALFVYIQDRSPRIFEHKSQQNTSYPRVWQIIYHSVKLSLTFVLIRYFGHMSAVVSTYAVVCTIYYLHAF